MQKIFLAALAMGVLTFSGPVFARGIGEAAEAEAARANSRAGGPTNYRDAELLKRYGGCPDYVRGNAFCDSLRPHHRSARRHRHDDD
jgi:hypothetical protein